MKNGAGTEALNTIVNVALVPQRSPFRYPGGKTWLVPQVRRWLASLSPRPRKLIEPFAGGGIVGLTAVFEGLTDEAVLVELDDDVAAVWQTILSDDALELADRIVAFDLSVDSVNDVLGSNPTTPMDKAFLTLLKNRVRYGGILASGACLVRQGENGRGLTSRWYPRTLKERVLHIAGMRDRITFIHGDGLQYLADGLHEPSYSWFIDPPYTVAGRRLYTHSDLDHERLFRVTSALAGEFLMTYDDAEEIRQLATRFGLDMEHVAMKSTKHEHKRELLVGRDLTWARQDLGVAQLVLDPALEHL